MRSPRLWVIIGATGTGKTQLSLDLAERLKLEHGVTAEIVNADAMQFYREMNIGTAKLAPDDRQGVAHHLFDVLDITIEATVAWYQPLARSLISQIHARGHDAILVGGSGLYVSSVVFDFNFPPRDEQLRGRLEREAELHGTQPLLARLRELDPRAAEAVDARNPRRVVRALEVAELGEKTQVTLPSDLQLWCAETMIIGVQVERTALVERLNSRVEQMWSAGLIEEVRSLIPAGIEQGKTASRAIGYAQALGQIRGELSEFEAIEQTQALTRKYARRQVSWFKRYPHVQWLSHPDASIIEGL